MSDVIGGMGTNAMLLHLEHRFVLWWCNIEATKQLLSAIHIFYSNSTFFRFFSVYFQIFFFCHLVGRCSVLHSKCESIFAACCISTRLYSCTFVSKLNMFTLFGLVWFLVFGVRCSHCAGGIMHSSPITATENVIPMLLWVMPIYFIRSQEMYIDYKR